MKRPTLSRHQDAVERWNDQHDIGQPVTVRRLIGAAVPTRTESRALLHAGRAVIHVAGLPGLHDLDRVTPVKVPTEKAA